MFSKHGFTLLELLIVIAIIGLLLAIVVASMAESKRKSRNTNVMSQMFEYQKALELHYSTSGVYPIAHPTTRSRKICFGDGAAPGCMPGSFGVVYPGNALETALLQTVAALPRFNQPRGPFSYSSPITSGCTGTGVAETNCADSQYSIYFFLEGINEDCGRALVANSNLGGEYTLCRLMP